MSKATGEKETLANLERQVQTLNDEISIQKVAKTQGEACLEIIEYSEKAVEPFAVGAGNDASGGGVSNNPWHKNPKGKGGCVIL